MSSRAGQASVAYLVRDVKDEETPMAQQGAAIRITFDGGTPTSDVITLDIEWDTNDLSTGKWAGRLALFGGTGTDLGTWDWNSSTKLLRLWANPVPGGVPILVARLNDFQLPTISGGQGSGRLAEGITPTIQPPTFVWKIP
jgi:hypothetical protein